MSKLIEVVSSGHRNILPVVIVYSGFTGIANRGLVQHFVMVPRIASTEC